MPGGGKSDASCRQRRCFMLSRRETGERRRQKTAEEVIEPRPGSVLDEMIPSWPFHDAGDGCTGRAWRFRTTGAAGSGCGGCTPDRTVRHDDHRTASRQAMRSTRSGKSESSVRAARARAYTDRDRRVGRPQLATVRASGDQEVPRTTDRPDPKGPALAYRQEPFKLKAVELLWGRLSECDRAAFLDQLRQ
jgi:hypothetical protein